jgi:hypothetical protein
MTAKQIESVKAKIVKYKKALAADKKRGGGYYDDSRGIRYVIPEQYIKIKDYKGALLYFNWFNKNFPDDSGFPIFLFEWALTLFKCKKLFEAEKKVHRTFFANTYLLNKFLGKEPLHLGKKENSNWEFESLTEYFSYSHKDTELIEFADWVTTVLQSGKLYQFPAESL